MRTLNSGINRNRTIEKVMIYKITFYFNKFY